MHNTFRRDKLKRLCQAGRLICVSSYSFDDMHGESRGAKEMPVVFKEPGESWKDGVIMLDEYHFTGSCGRASQAENGHVHLHVHSNLNFTFKILTVEEVAAANAAHLEAVRARHDLAVKQELEARAREDRQEQLAAANAV